MTEDVLLGQSGVLQYDKGFDGLAQDWIGHADDGRLDDALEAIEHVFYFFGRDFFAATFDDVVFAGNKIEIALLVHLKEIATVEDALAGLELALAHRTRASGLKRPPSPGEIKEALLEAYGGGRRAEARKKISKIFFRERSGE